MVVTHGLPFLSLSTDQARARRLASDLLLGPDLLQLLDVVLASREHLVKNLERQGAQVDRNAEVGSDCR